MVAAGFVWKIVIAVALAGAIVISVSARAPRKPVRWADLRWLLLGALALYAVGLIAFLKHESGAAALLAAGGIATSALAAWLSRGVDTPDDPPAGGEPPSLDPVGPLSFDWAQFERDLRAYTDRARDPVF